MVLLGGLFRLQQRKDKSSPFCRQVSKWLPIVIVPNQKKKKKKKKRRPDNFIPIPAYKAFFSSIKNVHYYLVLVKTPEQIFIGTGLLEANCASSTTPCVYFCKQRFLLTTIQGLLSQINSPPESKKMVCTSMDVVLPTCLSYPWSISANCLI